MKFENKNASGEAANCATIVNGFVSEGVDLIMANATAALTRPPLPRTADIPILGTSITDLRRGPGHLTTSTGTVGGNISGTSDLAAPGPAGRHDHTSWFPDAKNVGLLYCSAEPNSSYQIRRRSRPTWPTRAMTCTRSSPSPTPTTSPP